MSEWTIHPTYAGPVRFAKILDESNDPIWYANIRLHRDASKELRVYGLVVGEYGAKQYTELLNRRFATEDVLFIQYTFDQYIHPYVVSFIETLWKDRVELIRFEEDGHSYYSSRFD